MVENKKDEKTFKVEDRRTSSGKGKKDEPPDKAGKAPETRQAENTSQEGSANKASGTGGGISKVDFSTFIFSLFSSALIQMGDMADPMTGQMEKNLQAAQQTIDIIDVLVTKTEGNLSEEEDRLIKSASAELKWKYLDAVKESQKT